jgi:N-acetylneuraminate synthase
LELNFDQTLHLAQKCNEIGIEFLSTAFDEESLDFLVREIGVKKLKIASGEVTNGPLLFKHAVFGLPIFLSTGMTSFTEIDRALSVLDAGFMGKTPSAKFASKMKEKDSYVTGRSLTEVTLLQCTTEYPAPVAEANIRAMIAMGARYGLKVGFSDHTKGEVAAIVAVANGASVVEKHITIDNEKTSGPDHKASMNPDEFREYVQQIRLAETALGSDQKEIQPSEAQNLTAARKYIVAARDIREGERFSEDNLRTMRVGQGLSPMHHWRLLGKPASREYIDGEPIEDE